MGRRQDPRDKYTRTEHNYYSLVGLIPPVYRLDNAALHKGYRERARAGQEELRHFQTWLVSVCHYAYSTAVQVRRRVWAAIKETDGEPWRKADDERLSWSYRQKILIDLRKWAVYLLSIGRADICVECAQALHARCPDVDSTLESLLSPRVIGGSRGRRGGRVRMQRQERKAGSAAQEQDTAVMKPWMERVMARGGRA